MSAKKANTNKATYRITGEFDPQHLSDVESNIGTALTVLRPLASAQAEITVPAMTFKVD